jgi:hypothetical protein
MSQYPSSPESTLGARLTFRPSTLHAVHSFSRSKLWRGNFEERQAKFGKLHSDLCWIYNVNPTLIIQGDGTGDSGNSCFNRSTNTITLVGRLGLLKRKRRCR